MRIATPDLVTNSYFPALAAEELGLYREEGLDAHVELLPSLDAVNALRDGAVDFVAGGAHTMLLAFPGWRGAKLAVTLSQGTPWLLVLRVDLAARRGDVAAVKGLRIGAAPGPDRAFLQMLREVGVDPARDGVRIAPVPGALDPGASFGILAAEALERGLVDGFWANALGSETAVRRGVGKVVVDVRRGDGPPGAGQYTFAALSTTDALIAREPERVAAAVRAIVRAQSTLRDRKSTRLNSSHGYISYAVLCLKKKKYIVTFDLTAGTHYVFNLTFSQLPDVLYAAGCPEK